MYVCEAEARAAIVVTGSILAGLAATASVQSWALGGPTMILLGNPFSGVRSAPELMPEPAGALGRLMPPGAGQPAPQHRPVRRRGPA